MGSPHQQPVLELPNDRRTWSDERLISDCRKGDQAAWSALVDRYKALVYSVPTRFGLMPDAAKEVFQEVWLTLLRDLPSLRDPRAVAAWLAQTAWHKSMHWKRGQQRYTEIDEEGPRSSSPLPPELLAELQEEQAVRDAVAELSPRCAKLIEMLFFESPPVPYEVAAERLNLATGSISFIRQRCLNRLKARLRERGIG